MNKLFTYMFLLLVLTGCEKFISIDPPQNESSIESTFNSDASAISAMRGVYSSMVSASFATGPGSLTLLSGLSSDELNMFQGDDINRQYYQNNINPNNTLRIWQSMYSIIYQSNSILENLQLSSAVTAPTKMQLEGEARFVRAFVNFYLTNCFGRVPLVTTTDYRVNNSISKSSTDQIYTAIIDDLLESQKLLSQNYPSPERIRPNKATVTAFLAKVYLYRKDWANAELQSSLVINNASYELDDLGNVFLNTSKEAIWQLRPATNFTYEAILFLLGTSIDNKYVLSDALVKTFDASDQRKLAWIGSKNINSVDYNYSMKYKELADNASGTEYTMVLRLAEQFLIRAEARIQQDKISLGVEDLNTIRTRAGLIDLPLSLSKADAQSAVMTERQHELFTEWGNRWFDLLRTNQANLIMPGVMSIKGGTWSANDQLYPIPEEEILGNPNLKPQNSGY